MYIIGKHVWGGRVVCLYIKSSTSIDAHSNSEDAIRYFTMHTHAHADSWKEKPETRDYTLDHRYFLSTYYAPSSALPAGASAVDKKMTGPAVGGLREASRGDLMQPGGAIA